VVERNFIAWRSDSRGWREVGTERPQLDWTIFINVSISMRHGTRPFGARSHLLALNKPGPLTPILDVGQPALVLVATTGMVRVLLPVLPSHRVTVRLCAADVVLSVPRVLALAFRGGAMFYRSTVQSLPGAAEAVSEITC
jgi:hypothetical protein